MFIHAHREGEGDLSFYEDYVENKYAVWIYMPIDPDECVTEIWGRRGKLYQHMGLMVRSTHTLTMMITASNMTMIPAQFRTNKRCSMFAIHTSPLLQHINGGVIPKWTYLCSLPKDPTDIYFNLSPNGIHQLAIKQPVFCKNPTPLQMPTPYPRPYRHGIGDYFYSAASLGQVVEITPCRRQLGTYTPIVGLLFRYADGHRASIGEFRMDCLGETLRVDQAQNLHLGFARAEKIHPHVARLELSHPRETGSLYWLCMPWTGKLEWWFCFGHCKVYHEDQESPSLFN